MWIVCHMHVEGYAQAYLDIYILIQNLHEFYCGFALDSLRCNTSRNLAKEDELVS